MESISEKLEIAGAMGESPWWPVESSPSDVFAIAAEPRGSSAVVESTVRPGCTGTGGSMYSDWIEGCPCLVVWSARVVVGSVVVR
jgi:hypothetical protein